MLPSPDAANGRRSTHRPELRVSSEFSSAGARRKERTSRGFDFPIHFSASFILMSTRLRPGNLLTGNSPLSFARSIVSCLIPSSLSPRDSRRLDFDRARSGPPAA
jgi:hypothetical protein